MKRVKRSMILCLGLVVFFFSLGGHVSAESTHNDGQVTSPGGITFLQGKEEPITKPGTKPVSKVVTKVLPQTGEALKNYSLLGLGLLLIVAFWLVILKRRGKHEQ